MDAPHRRGVFADKKRRPEASSECLCQILPRDTRDREQALTAVFFVFQVEKFIKQHISYFIRRFSRVEVLTSVISPRTGRRERRAFPAPFSGLGWA